MKTRSVLISCALVAGCCFADAPGKQNAALGYEVEYLEADGLVYVDTGFVCNRENWDYRLDAALTSNSAWGGANGRLEFVANEGRGRRCQFRVTCFGDRRDLYLNGENQNLSASLGEKQTGHAILVLNYGRGAKPGSPKLSQSGRIYGFELYRDNQLVQNLLPAVDTNGVACFLDDVTGRIFRVGARRVAWLCRGGRSRLQRA